MTPTLHEHAVDRCTRHARFVPPGTSSNRGDDVSDADPTGTRQSPTSFLSSRIGRSTVAVIVIAALVVAGFLIFGSSSTPAESAAKREYVSWVTTYENDVRQAQYNLAMAQYGVSSGNLALARVGLVGLDTVQAAIPATVQSGNTQLDSDYAALYNAIPAGASYGPNGYGTDPTSGRTVFDRSQIVTIDNGVGTALSNLDHVESTLDMTYNVSNSPSSVQGWPDELSNAILADLSGPGGLPRAELDVSTNLDRVNSNWAEFSVAGQPKYFLTVQGAYGFAHLVNGQWKVIGPGSEDVGCAGQGVAQSVPTSVLSYFGQTCSPS